MTRRRDIPGIPNTVTNSTILSGYRRVDMNYTLKTNLKLLNYRYTHSHDYFRQPAITERLGYWEADTYEH